MEIKERHDYIVDHIKKHKFVKVNELAIYLEVTPETIRKDLSLLEENKLLTRVHGGAVKYKYSNKEMALQKRMAINSETKRKLAKRAAEFIQSGDTIIVDVGTTTCYIADYLEDISDLTVVTNSLIACEYFNRALEERRISGEIIMLGGVSNPEQRAISGAITVQQIGDFTFDKAFISCGSFNNEFIYDFDMNESLCSRMMLKQSQFNILITDKSKYKKKPLYKISNYDSIQCVITNFAQPEEIIEQSKLEWIDIKR
ncbi:DeoR/GlpR family DNA-binding transcription regulator [Macrococcus equi]|uniref:DeoR/GlpR family DNA-binding transcription regulator n=1 Tax=Macrococcus equi TaxID=3395462 RepID=UPI0039BDE53B